MVEISGDFPFMLSLVEAFLGFFSRIRLHTSTLRDQKRNMLDKVFGDEFVNGINILIVDGFIYGSLNDFLIVDKDHRNSFLACECVPSCRTLSSADAVKQSSKAMS